MLIPYTLHLTSFEIYVATLPLPQPMSKTESPLLIFKCLISSISENYIRNCETRKVEPDPKKIQGMTGEEILGLLDPEQYTGLSAYFAEEFAIKAEQKSKELLGR